MAEHLQSQVSGRPRGKQKTRLRGSTLLALLLWVATFLVCIAGMLVASIRLQCRDEKAETSYFLVSQSFRAAAALLNGVGCGSYIYVSVIAARPRELHHHGVVLMLMMPELAGLMLAGILECEEMYAASWVAVALSFSTWCIHRVLLFYLIVQKISALGRPSSCCLDIQRWGKALNGSVLTASFAGIVPSYLWSALLLARGFSYEEVNSSFTPTGLAVPEQVLVLTMSVLGNLGGAGIVISSCGFVAVAVHRTRSALRKMVNRQVSGPRLDCARHTLLQHVTGLLLSTVSNTLVVLVAAVMPLNLVGEDVENAMLSGTHFLDLAGDITGILLLSGIGVLLWREDPYAGDVVSEIRAVIYSAVLTSRAQTVFEGRVALTPSRACIVSFPGKFMPEWNGLTWLCEQGELSAACVFLPKSDPRQRFGQHSPCPDTPGKCWCSSLYGSIKPWGCRWFEAWKANVEEAVKLELDLVVVFFPGQVGQGLVSWDELGGANLWDGTGLGGSQKAEAAYLQKQGYRFLQEDLTATRSRINVSQSRLNGALVAQAKGYGINRS